MSDIRDFVIGIDGLLQCYLGTGGNVVIPDGVKSIGESVFSHRGNITSITIPDSVTEIGDYAFLKCKSLTSITIPNGVTSIGNAAFYACDSLTSVTIPSSVTSIGKEAFLECGKLERVDISDIAAWCNISFDDEFANPLSVAYNLYLNGELVTDLVIPEGVTKICKYAFFFCESLASITIPNSVTSIDCGAFESLHIKSVYISDMAAWLNISFGGSNAKPPHNLYLNGELITDFVIPDGVTKIGTSAFANWRGLRSITIPDSVTSIGKVAFLKCDKLERVDISDIAAWCNISFDDEFANPLSRAHNLYLNGELVTDLVIPEGVTKICQYAFCGCESLASITIPDSVTEIGDYAFLKCKSLTSITIPNSVTRIGTYAFYDCRSLTSVTISDSVTSIGENAFKNTFSRHYNKYDNAYYLGNADNPYRFLMKARSKTIKTCKIHQDCKIIYDCAFA